MKICAISDIHGNLIDLPDSDLCIVCGDLCPTHNHNVFFQAEWINDSFRRWVNKIPAKKVVYIAGNHDFVFQDKKHLLTLDQINGTYLEDSQTTFEGLKIYGSPWQPIFFDWSFNATEEELEKKWAKIPSDTDILALHGPPQGYGDLTNKGDRTGSPSLTKRILELNLKAAFAGHIHNGFGSYHIGDTPFYNVSILDESYQIKNPPTVITI
jgi:Icc-related predicted phosphoesterase